MLEKVKLALRLKNNLFDSEINLYIEACKTNLELCGVKKDKLVDTDNAIANAIICYCKWQLNFQNKGEAWKANYDRLKNALALDTNYCV